MAFPGRTDATQVGSVIEVDTGIPLDPFIDVANELVTEFCSEAGYTDARLVKIETWLAAHFYAVRDPRTMSVGVSGVSVSFGRGITAVGLKHTSYGQQALILDTKGGLASLDKRIERGAGRPQVVWLGTDSEDEE